jgi:cysteine desulfurase/selenocysteine lyase
MPTPTAEASPLDLAALARMAADFFAAPPTAAPGGLALPSNPLPPGLPRGPLPQPTTTQFGGVAATVPGLNLVPTGPDQAAARLRPSPAQMPHAAAGNGLPDTLVGSAPGIDSRLGGQVLGVPPVFLPPGQFYFIDPARHPGPHGHHAGAVPDLGQRAAARMPFDVQAIRRDFPILAEHVNGRQLVWFDNAATTQKPRAVIDRLVRFYEHENSNVHRAAHELAARSTDAYEHARATVARYIGAGRSDEIVFARGATEAINLVARSWGAQHIGEGDEIVVSHLEHHANIVPWQQLAAEKGARLRVIPVDDSGQIILSEFQRLLGPRTRLVAVTQVSNALGTVVPVQEIVAAARRVGATTLVDGAQSVSHMAVDVQAIGCDFFVFSGHKVFGPTGIGVVWGRKELLDATQPYQHGGNMIADVTFERSLFQDAPARFEAGTGNIADAVGLGAALDYVQRIGLANIERYEHDLLAYATDAIRPIPGLRLIGTAAAKASVLSFTLEGFSTEDVGRALNEDGIAVRSGHHCAQPILRRFGVEATVRPSLAFYNTCDEVDRMVAVLRRLARA